MEAILDGGTHEPGAPPPAESALVRGWQTAPPPFASLAAAERPDPTAPASPVRGEPPPTDESSPLLVSLQAGDDLASSARRAGAGLALCVPFALAAGLRTGSSLEDAALAALGLPVGLALVALVGVSASTLGISLVSAPLEPAAAASVASRGLFRAGLVLGGLAPLTALWTASGRPLEALFLGSLVVFAAGVAGIGTIARGLVARTAEPDGSPRLGALVVSALFVVFALVVGLRVWIPVVEVLGAPLFPGID